jgi:UDP-N-acetylmuramoyl-L-alanyl-D-glutamate--2,6-diaminopimelate ligase
VAETPAPIGRCTATDVGAEWDVVRDFAKNPDGFATALATARLVAADRGTRVLAVVSASPVDDRRCLEAMGRAAGDGADAVVVTTERWEDRGPAEPPADLLRGVRAGRARVEVEPTRRSALRRAASLATPGDVVVVVGRSPVPRPQVDADGVTERFDDVAELRAAVTAAAA